MQPPQAPAGYEPLTPHASRNLGREGDRRIYGRTRSQARDIGQQQLSPLPEDAASTPLPQPSSSDDHNQGLLSFAGRDVLLSMLATHNVVDNEREMRGVSEPGGLQECKGAQPDDDPGGGEYGDGGWSSGSTGRRVSFGLLAHLATREDIDSALRDTEPPHIRPDMPLCHARDLRVPKSYAEMKRGENSVQFLDAVKREVHGLIEAGAFEVVDE